MQTKPYKSQRTKLERAGTIHWFHWLVVGLSLGVTFLAWGYSKHQLHLKVEAQFEREADQVIELVQERMRRYEDALTSTTNLGLTTRNRFTSSRSTQG